MVLAMNNQPKHLLVVYSYCSCTANSYSSGIVVFPTVMGCLEKQGCQLIYSDTLAVQCEVPRMFANVRWCALTEWFYMVFRG